MNAAFPKPFSTLPRLAHERITKNYENGGKKKAEYYLEDELIWRRSWDRTGRRNYDQSYRQGVPHGVCRYWHGNGVLSHETSYLHGREHGTSRQYDECGDLLGLYTMVHGTGIDRWYQRFGNEPVMLAEERCYKDGTLNGYERWYWSTRDKNTTWQENHFHNGVEHGIFREWNKQGQLSRHFPQFYLQGERVDEHRYVIACRYDVSLPRFRPEDNDWHRELLAP